jgi:excisionase family DNA binding protein
MNYEMIGASLLCHDYICKEWHLVVFVLWFLRFFDWRTLVETLLSVEEAARRLGGISKWTLYAWLSQGRLQRTKVGGRTMIRESELAKVIDDGGKSPAPRRA